MVDSTFEGEEFDPTATVGRLTEELRLPYDGPAVAEEIAQYLTELAASATRAGITIPQISDAVAAATADCISMLGDDRHLEQRPLDDVISIIMRRIQREVAPLQTIIDGDVWFVINTCANALCRNLGAWGDTKPRLGGISSMDFMITIAKGLNSRNLTPTQCQRALTEAFPKLTKKNSPKRKGQKYVPDNRSPRQRAVDFIQSLDEITNKMVQETSNEPTK